MTKIGFLPATLTTLALAGSAYAVPLGINTTDPTANGAVSITIFSDTLDAFGSVAASTSAGLVGQDVFFLFDAIGGDLELDIEIAEVLDVGFFDQTLEFLLSDELIAFPDGAVLQLTSDIFAGVTDYEDVTSFFEATYSDGASDPDARFVLSAVAPIPLPGTIFAFLSALVAVRVFGDSFRRTTG